MKIINQSLLDRSDAFFRSIKPTDKIALLHDTDPDGTTSGKIITHAIERLGGKISLFLITERKIHTISDKIISSMKQQRINILITTDKTVDSGPEQIKKIEQFAHIVIFDHHIIEHDVSSAKTLLLKPQLIFDTDRPDQYCSAKISYDILNRVINLNDLDWICVSGIIADMAFPMWKKFIDKVFKKYNLPKKKNLFDTQLGEIAQLISYAEALDEPETCFELILKSKNINDTLKKLHKYNKIKKEVDYYTNNAASLGEWHNKKSLLILEIKSKHKIKSMVSSKIAHALYPHKTIIVIQKIDNQITISARRNDLKKNMNTLLKKSLGSLPGNAGGHAPASGGSVSIKEYPAFKENLIQNEKNMKPAP